MSPSAEVVSNAEIVLWALDQLGGAAEFVDIETVFLKCFELAPQRFSWRTRPELPDFKKCAKALQEAEARRPNPLVKTGDTFGRQLSVDGQKWIEANRSRLIARLKSGEKVPEPKRRPRSRMLAEADRSDVFAAWSAEGTLPMEKWRMAEFLRCSPDSDTSIWRNRLETLRSAANAADHELLLKFLDAVAAAKPDWFGEEPAK
jgi:hypothetical protein